MSTIDYSHAGNIHTLEGPQAALPRLFDGGVPASLLDVGCGTGTWLAAAAGLGLTDLAGIDGIAPPGGGALRPPMQFHVIDFRHTWDLRRKFDVVLCLEVAEHLEPDSGAALITSLVRHSDWVIFSAACPGQTGQHHVNCQWPDYWQQRFNEHGFACADDLRWKLWNDHRVEPWYRQNLFSARRSPHAGSEPRIPAVVHPELAGRLNLSEALPTAIPADHLRQIEDGLMATSWYLKVPFRALWSKCTRRLRRG